MNTAVYIFLLHVYLAIKGISCNIPAKYEIYGEIQLQLCTYTCPTS